jgi:hypothetical protein
MKNVETRVGYISDLPNADDAYNFYTMRYFCFNCNHRGNEEIRKGKPAMPTTCPVCGCLNFRAV